VDYFLQAKLVYVVALRTESGNSSDWLQANLSGIGRNVGWQLATVP
jgi:hypothetical protein